MTVVFGLPVRFSTRILGEILSADKRQRKLALVSTIQSPPIEALELFKVAEEITTACSEDN